MSTAPDLDAVSELDSELVMVWTGEYVEIIKTLL